jgi:hypothetical protein
MRLTGRTLTWTDGEEERLRSGMDRCDEAGPTKRPRGALEVRHSTAKQRVNRVEATSTSGQSGGEEREAGRIT